MTFARALQRYYNPPVRGLHSKRHRIRKKAERKYRSTLRYHLTKPSLTLRPLISERDREIWQTTALMDMTVFGTSFWETRDDGTVVRLQPY